MKNIFRIFAISALAVAAFSCDEYSEEKPKIDTPALFSLFSEDAGEEIIVLEPNSKTISVKVFAESISDQNVEISLAVNTDLVAEYNKANNTNHPLLAADAYEIPETPLYLPRYNKESSLMNIKLKTETLPDEQVYILPLTIGKVDGTENYELSETGKNVFIKFRKKEVPKPVELDKTGWKILYCSSWMSEMNKGIETGFPEHMLDGNWATYWGYNSKAAGSDPSFYVPIYVVLDLGAEKTLRGAHFTARRVDITNFDSGPWSPPARCKFEFSNSLSDLPDLAEDLANYDIKKGMNDADWTSAENFDTDVLKNVNEQTVDFQNPHNARYVRFTYIMGWNRSSGNANYKGAMMGELEILGHEEVLEIE